MSSSDLVDSVKTAIDGQTLESASIRSILACADWLESHQVGVGVVSARWLRQEAAKIAPEQPRTFASSK